LVLYLVTLFSCYPHPVEHRFDPFRTGPPPMLRSSRTILQTQRGSFRTIPIDPPIHPRTRPLQLSGDLTLLPTLQIQCHGSFAQRDLGLHPATSWFLHQKV
jgi:hypothetical protein